MRIVSNRELFESFMGDSVPQPTQPAALVEFEPVVWEPGHLENVLRVWELGADEYLRQFPLTIPE